MTKNQSRNVNVRQDSNGYVGNEDDDHSISDDIDNDTHVEEESGEYKQKKQKRIHVCDRDCQVQVHTCAGVLEYLATKAPEWEKVVHEVDQAENDADRQERLLTTALAILVDSTSPGPDPLSLSALGWAYGMGAGGGMGDWGACNYVPGEIGQELRELEKTVASKVQMEFGDYQPDTSPVDANEEVFDSEWVAPATRFCTVGGLPPNKIAYAPGALWQPPIAGICVPASCSSNDLLALFHDDGWRESLKQKAASVTTSTDSTMALDGNITTVQSIKIPPAATRRYKYISSLSLSITTGIKFKMGIQCAGETGLAQLDEAFYKDVPFRGLDYMFTMALIGILFCFVLVGTATSRWGMTEEDVVVASLNEPRELSRSSSVGQPQSNDEMVGLMTKYVHDTMPEGSSATQGYGATIGEVDLNSNSKSPSRKQIVGFLGHFMRRLGHIFSPFDATQSFYEITRLSRDSPYDEIAHQQATKQLGEGTLDRAHSSIGLFPSYLKEEEGSVAAQVTSQSVSSSQCLNGLRGISMIWIILGHTIVVQSSIGYQNPSAVLPPTGMISSTPAMFFFSARYAVDTFFFIGGYLVMSGLLKKLDPMVIFGDKNDGETCVSRTEQCLYDYNIAKPFHRVLGTYAHRLQVTKKSREAPPGVMKWILPFLLHRILRILPTYGFVLLIWWKLAVTWGNGPFWARWATFVAQCDKYAWTNMLFVNNLIPWKQKFGESSECMYHAWYLGVDFQLCAVLTPIFVTTFLRRGYRRTTILFELLLIALVTSVTFINTYQRDWSGHLMDGSQTLSFDRDAYINPFYRATPYVAGFITAQIWHEKSLLCPHLGLRKEVSTVLSIVAVLSILLLTFLGSTAYDNIPCQIWQDMHTAGCGSGWSMHALAIYNSCVRPSWSLCLAIITLLGFNGQLHPICGSSVLNWNGWDPIAKLSFGMYLLHPMVINLWFLSRTSKFSYSHVDFVFLCAGVVAVTFIAALLVGILVEWPMSKLAKQLETRIERRKRKTNIQSENNMDA